MITLFRLWVFLPVIAVGIAALVVATGATWDWD